MRKPPRVVLDTNVLISSFILKKGVYPLVEAWLKDGFLWILSPEIQEEYLSVISRPKFRLTREEIRDVFTLLETGLATGVIQRVEPMTRLHVVKEDPKDNIFLECGISGEADYIVTGDHHLLNLGSYQDISILSLSGFLEILE